MSKIVLQDKTHRYRNVEVRVQHSGNINQSSTVMFFGDDTTLFSLDEEETGKLINGIIRNWKGKKPENFPKIVTKKSREKKEE